MFLSFYNTADLCSRYSELNGVELLQDHKQLLRTNNSMFHDRTETVTLPLKIKNLFPIPTMPNRFTKSYEEICAETTMRIADQAIRGSKKIKILWSGGIDSTLIIVNFLKLGFGDLLEVALTLESIHENPEFYMEHLLKGGIKLVPANDLKSLSRPGYIVVGGEYNDQLFGSNLIIAFEKYFDSEELFKPFDRKTLLSVFNCDKDKMRNEKSLDVWIDAYTEICKKSPAPIETNFDFHWWINFSCKWQGLYYRLFSYFDQRFDANDYIQFFLNDDFQLWSIFNIAKRFDGYQNYKRICRDLIFEFDKNKQYKNNKKKIESLFFLAQKNRQFNYICEFNNFYSDLPNGSINLDFKSLL